MIAQRFPYLPVPVSANAISPAIPDTQHKPGKCSKEHGDQMQLSCFWKNPTNDIKQGKNRMKDEEEDIEELIPHTLLSPAGKVKFIPSGPIRGQRIWSASPDSYWN